MLSFVASIVLGAAVVSAQTSVTEVPNTSTDVAAIATELAKPVVTPQSNVKGKVFDRFINIMMENTDFPLAASDPNMKLLAAKGITLSNYYGVTHPSEPNYCAIYGGDHFGMDNDAFNEIPANVSNVWDLLSDKGISYSAYQENLPYPGFEGFAFLDPQSGANNYVRKHNPPVLFNSNAARFDHIKSFSALQEDVDANVLAQHIFLTPNMLNDAHDTGITYGADFLYQFLAPLLDNPGFMNNTLLLINFDETGTYAHSNDVFSILISDTMPAELIGTTDDTVYTHYSALSTVEANWGLDTLGRWDVGANVFKYVADVTGDEIRQPNVPIGDFYFNSSYAGALATKKFAPMPVPNTNLVQNGRKVFKDVVAQWGGLQECTYYEDVVVAPDGMRPPKAIPASCAGVAPAPLTSSASSSSSSSTAATTILTSTISIATSASGSPSGYSNSTTWSFPSSIATTASASPSGYSNSTTSFTGSSATSVGVSPTSVVSGVVSSGASAGTPSSLASTTEYTTSTIRATSVITVTSCAATVTDCPAGPHVTTVVIDISTTICPVTATETTPIVSETTPAAGETTTTVSEILTYTTTCASPTTLTVGTNTYTVTASTVLTVTDCQCTHTTAAVIPATSVPAVSVITTAPAVPVSSPGGLISTIPAVSVISSAPAVPVISSVPAVPVVSSAPAVPVISPAPTVAISYPGGLISSVPAVVISAPSGVLSSLVTLPTESAPIATSPVAPVSEISTVVAPTPASETVLPTGGATVSSTPPTFTGAASSISSQWSVVAFVAMFAALI